MGTGQSRRTGGSLTPAAVLRLVEYVGNNTQRAVQEITKLLTYVNYARPVDDDDVIRLTAQEQQASIFDMVDAIGDRDGQEAVKTCTSCWRIAIPCRSSG